MDFEFEAFEKIARLKRETVITEKLDGTNAQVAIFELDSDEARDSAASNPYCIRVFNGEVTVAMFAGSRKRWIAPEGYVPIPGNKGNAMAKGTDNFAFAHFVAENADELVKMGPGRHYGEWYGSGIQRGYGLDEKRFALFNTARWGDHNPNTPSCCEVVTVLVSDAEEAMSSLFVHGSKHVNGFMKPEGIVVYHTASRNLYKQTFENDGGKWRE